MRVVSWADGDRENEDHEPHGAPSPKMLWRATAFGRDQECKPASVSFGGFRPFFFADLEGGPEVTWAVARRVASSLEEALGRWMSAEIAGVEVVQMGSLFGHSLASRRRPLLRLSFHSKRAWKASSQALRPDTVPAPPEGADKKYADRLRALARRPPVRVGRHRLRLYESGGKFEPLLRLIQGSDIDACGWVRASVDASGDAPAASLSPCEPPGGRAGSVLVGAFDIECLSLNMATFPATSKDYFGVVMAVQRALRPDTPVPGADAIDPRDRVYAAVRLALGLAPAEGEPPPLPEALARQAVLYTEHLPEGWAAAMEQRGGLREALTPLCLDQIMHLVLGRVRYEDRDPMREAAKLLGEKLPALEGDPVVQIGLTLNWSGETVSRRWIGVLGTCDPVEGADVECFDTESELLIGFAARIAEWDPDVLVGWNIYNFDMRYCAERARVLGCEPGFLKRLARGGGSARYVVRSSTTQAAGDTEHHYWDIPGREAVDLLVLARRDYASMPSHRLDAVAERLLGDRKHDLPPTELFALQKSDSAGRARVARYCIQDCELCNRLAERMCAVGNAMEMASVACVPLGYVLHRGQSIKVTSSVTKECAARGLVVPDIIGRPEYVSVPGATVLPPMSGFYEEPVFVVDFNSLYPSVCRARNLSHDSLELDGDAAAAAVASGEFTAVRMDLAGPGETHRPVWFLRSARDPDRLGVIPHLMGRLLEQRKATRRQATNSTIELRGGRVLSGVFSGTPEGGGTLALHPSGGAAVIGAGEIVSVRPMYDDRERQVLESKQLAYKVLANTFYGQTATQTGALYEPLVAMAITQSGRESLRQARDHFEAGGARVVYGDTDSLFFTLPGFDRGRADESCDALCSAARALEASFNRSLSKYMRIELEKVYRPFLLVTRKRYAGIRCAPGTGVSRGRLECHGIETERKDSTPLLRGILHGFLDGVMAGDVGRAWDQLVEAHEVLLRGETPIAQLVFSKKVKASYKGKTVQGAVAGRKRARGVPVAPGDSVVWVVTRKRGQRGAGVTDMAEDPEYAVANGMPIDIQYYIESLRGPVTKILSGLVERLPFWKLSPGHFAERRDKISAALRLPPWHEEVQKAIDAEREDAVVRGFYAPLLARAENSARRQRTLDDVWGNKRQ
jgi:DNA polymerase elongation subunit (family B)